MMHCTPWRSVAAGLVVLFASVTPAHAQADFTTAPVIVGDSVRVAAPSLGGAITGRLTAITPTSITVDSKRIDHEPGLRLARQGDSLLNGILIGAAIGVVAGSTIGAEACLDESLVYCAIGGSAVWGAIGAFVDYRHKGYTVVYRDPPKAVVRVIPSI